MPIHPPKLPQNPKLQFAGQLLRNEMTREERHLWYDFLRAFRPQCYRQYTIGNYIVDCYCPAARLVKEVDGAPHFTNIGRANDTVRTAYLNSLDIRVIRFTDHEVMQRFDTVCQCITQYVQKTLCH